MLRTVLLQWLDAAPHPSLDGGSQPSRQPCFERNAKQRGETALAVRQGQGTQPRVGPASFTVPVLVEVAGSSLARGSIAGEPFSSLFEHSRNNAAKKLGYVSQGKGRFVILLLACTIDCVTMGPAPPSGCLC